MNTPTLETQRLILRKFTENDMEAFYAIYSDVEVNKFLPWFPLQSIGEAKAFFVKKYEKEYACSYGYQYAICLKSNNIPIGYVGISTEDSHDLGYGLRKEFWHKGIVSEACKAVTTQAKEDGMLYITATHDIHNPRSGNVMKSVGMSYKYSYKELWQPKNLLITFRMYQLNFDGNDSRIYKEYWNRYGNHFIENL